MSGPRATGASGKRRSAERRITRDRADLLDRAIERRDDWLSWALCTLPADRRAAEAAITSLYRLAGYGPPRFVWVESPGAAAEAGLIREPPRLRAMAVSRDDPWPVRERLATMSLALRESLDGRLPPRRAWWAPRERALRNARSVPPQESLQAGLTLHELLRLTVRESLTDSVHESLARHLRTTLATPGMTWYGQHEAGWIAEHDVNRELGRRYAPDDCAQLDLWAALARSCGWWWPDEDICVVSERPTAVHTEPVPGTVHGQVRPHSGKGQAVRYADGWGVHCWHGTLVPPWVVTEPTVERIAAERNVEVRRCAIERLGWDVYIDRAGLDLVSSAPDPGNPGCTLLLYSMPERAWGAPARVLLAVNGSVERDGTRRRYGLSVPADIDDPVSAAGWSYGLTGDQYAQLLRRT